jgi:mannose-6-phosphate isomerase-like protein (cupin superfamily)
MSDEHISGASLPLGQLMRAPLRDNLLGLPSSTFLVAEWSDPGAPDGNPLPMAPLHVHHADDEAWYVLEGTLAFQLGEHVVEAPAGAAVFAPRGLPHTYWNPRPTPARYLIILTPNIAALIDELHAAGTHEHEAQQAIYRRHTSSLAHQ